MAGAYATFAADGTRREPFFVQKYTNSTGTVEYQHVDKPQPAFDPMDPARNTQLARNVTATLTDVARSSQIPLAGGRQVAAKTGTHQLGDTGHNAAAWMVGYTPSISTAVWVGDPANSAIKDADGTDIFGRGLPGAIWQRFMNSYLQNTPIQTFPSFKLIGSPPPTVVTTQASATPRTHALRRTEPSATPEPDFPPTKPTPIAPSTPTKPTPVEPSTKAAKPRRNNCFPLCIGPGGG